MKRPILVGIGISFLAGSILWGTENNDGIKKEKRDLLPNRILVYNQVPPRVTSLQDFLTKGAWYGRLRLNTFRWDWKEETEKTKDNWAVGIGGSLTLKTAYFYGLGATIDAYTSQNPWHMKKEEIPFLKAGKDTLSRYDVYDKNRYDMNVIAQLYVEYKLNRSDIKYGRQKFESFLTKSNDTKMIPNTFEGISLISKDLPKHLFKLAWFRKQKLRDHTKFHDVITFKNEEGEKWGNNDDSGGHKGLSYQNFVKAGADPDHDLLVAEVWSYAVPKLKAMVNYTAVPNVLSSATLEGHYTLKAGHYKIVPGLRYMRQFDNGGGAIGGASVTGAYVASDTSAQGYKHPYSLDSWLFAARVDLKSDRPWKVRLAYSQVGDEADIVAPWRGFPTGGFTRAMGQYNWYANTKTTMIRGDWDFEKAGMVKGLWAMFRLAYEDYDDSKIGMKGTKRFYLQPTDRTVLHLDAIYKIPFVRGLEARLRMAFVDAADQLDGVDPSYNEYRFEMNYLF